MKFVRQDVIEAGETTCEQCEHKVRRQYPRKWSLFECLMFRDEGGEAVMLLGGADAQRYQDCLRDFRPVAEEVGDG